MRLERLLALLTFVGVLIMSASQAQSVLASARSDPAPPASLTAPSPAEQPVPDLPAADSSAGGADDLAAIHAAQAAFPPRTDRLAPIRAAIPTAGVAGRAPHLRTLPPAGKTAAKPWGPLYADSRANGVRTAVNGCPTRALPGTVPSGLPGKLTLLSLCTAALNRAPDATARTAIRFAFLHLGSTYACGGIGRERPWTFDCSSFVSRAYRAAGARTTVNGWSPNTAYMLSPAQRTFRPIRAVNALPGDLVLYDTCPAVETCAYRHVVMYLGSIGGQRWMMHTNSCGSPAKLAPFWGWDGDGHGEFLGVRRVARPAGSAHR